MELLSTFQLFNHNNGRLPLTNGLLIVPDDDVPGGEDKINRKNLYEMFRYMQSHGLVSMQFLGVLGTFFGVGVRETKDTITELCKNLLYASLSGANDFKFDAISELISRLSFSIKKKQTALANRDTREKQDTEKAKEIIDTTTFVEQLDPFEQEIVDDLFKDLEHKKTKHPYVEPQVKDAQTIETRTQATNNEFFLTKSTI